MTEIFTDFGLEKLCGNFRNPDVPLVYESLDGWETELHYPTVLLSDLAALLLECKVSGSIPLCELLGEDSETVVPALRITAFAEDYKLLNKVLSDFAAAPHSYDFSEIIPEEVLPETAALCDALRKELYL